MARKVGEGEQEVPQFRRIASDCLDWRAAFSSWASSMTLSRTSSANFQSKPTCAAFSVTRTNGGGRKVAGDSESARFPSFAFCFSQLASTDSALGAHPGEQRREVPSHHFSTTRSTARKSNVPFSLRQTRMKDNLKQEVTQFFTQLFGRLLIRASRAYRVCSNQIGLQVRWVCSDPKRHPSGVSQGCHDLYQCGGRCIHGGLLRWRGRYWESLSNWISPLPSICENHSPQGTRCAEMLHSRGLLVSIRWRWPPSVLRPAASR